MRGGGATELAGAMSGFTVPCDRTMGSTLGAPPSKVRSSKVRELGMGMGPAGQTLARVWA